MISAKQAQEQTGAYEIKNELDDMDKAIKKATKAGKKECFVKANLKKETIDSLTDLDFIVKPEIGRTRISW